MNLPFTSEQFFELFRDYNLFVWPIQFVFYVLVIVIFYYIFKSSLKGSRVILFILSFLWGWMGIIYHLSFFSVINKAAFIFGLLFVIQGVFFLLSIVFNHYFLFSYRSNLYGITGAFLIIFSVLIYPILNIAAGHQFPASPTFGLPCPTTIFTLGLLLLNEKKNPLFILIIPLLWSVVGFTAALTLGIYEDISLLIAGILSFILVIKKNRDIEKVTPLSV